MSLSAGVGSVGQATPGIVLTTLAAQNHLPPWRHHGGMSSRNVKCGTVHGTLSRLVWFGRPARGLAPPEGPSLSEAMWCCDGDAGGSDRDLGQVAVPT